MDNGLDITKGYHIDTLLEHGRESLKKAKDNIAELASHEGLDAHGKSVLIRFEE